MATRNDPAVELELDPLDAGAEPTYLNQCVIAYFVPHYQSDGPYLRRSDPGVPREKLGSVSNTEDMAGTVRRFARRPGAYLAELRIDGRVQDSQVFIIKQREQAIEVDAPYAVQHGAPTPQYYSQPPRHISDDPNIEIARLKRAVVEVARGQRAARVTGAHPRRVRRSAARVVTPPSLVEQMEQLVEAAEKIDAYKSKHMPQAERVSNPELDVDPRKEAMSLLLEDHRFRRMAIESVIGTAEGGGDQRHWVVEGLDTVFENADKLPLLGQAAGHLIGGLFGRGTQPQARAQATPQPPQHAPAAQSLPQPSPLPSASVQPQQSAEQKPPPVYEVELGMVIENMLPDLDKDASVKLSARDFVSLFKDFPGRAPEIENLLSQPPETILRTLAAIHPACAPIVSKPHAAAWIERLQKEVARRTQLPVKAASLNGNGLPM